MPTWSLKRLGSKHQKQQAAFSEESAIAVLDKIGYPAVIKPTVGSWGRLIALLRDEDAGKSRNRGQRAHVSPVSSILF